MAKKVKQFRYYSENHGNNYPAASQGGPTWRNLVSGSVFTNTRPILQLGIQSLPGTKFYLNGSSNPIIIGYTGIYELDLKGLTEINSLQFSPESITAIRDNPSAYLIIDIIYSDNNAEKEES